MTSLFAVLCIIHFRKMVYAKRKEFAPFRVDPFSEGGQNKFDRLLFPESVFIPFKVLIVEFNRYLH